MFFIVGNDYVFGLTGKGQRVTENVFIPSKRLVVTHLPLTIDRLPFLSFRYFVHSAHENIAHGGDIFTKRMDFYLRKKRLQKLVGSTSSG